MEKANKNIVHRPILPLSIGPPSSFPVGLKNNELPRLALGLVCTIAYHIVLLAAGQTVTQVLRWCW